MGPNRQAVHGDDPRLPGVVPPAVLGTLRGAPCALLEPLDAGTSASRGGAREDSHRVLAERVGARLDANVILGHGLYFVLLNRVDSEWPSFMCSRLSHRIYSFPSIDVCS